MKAIFLFGCFLLLCCTFSLFWLFTIFFLQNILYSFGIDNDWRLLMMDFVFVYVIAFGRACVHVVAVRNRDFIVCFSFKFVSKPVKLFSDVNLTNG